MTPRRIGWANLFARVFAVDVTVCCRYLLRPPFAHDAVEAKGDGRVRVHFSSIEA